MKSILAPFCLLLLSTIALSCSHLSSTAPATERSVAAVLEWVAHPCRESGRPFRKYVDFALDPADGKIYGRQSPDGELKPINTRASSVAAFFTEAGITACDQAATPTPPQGRPAPTEPEERGGDNRPNRVAIPWTSPIQNNLNLYYGTLKRQLSNTRSDIRAQIRSFLMSVHVQKVGSEDKITLECPKTLSVGEKCVSQINYGNKQGQAYEHARQNLMGFMDLKQLPNGEYVIFDHYCQTWLDKKYFIDKKGDPNAVPGPHQIVHSEVVNCEHTWPRSKFVADKNSAEFVQQESDVHHLLSTSKIINSLRENYEFAEVNPTGAKISACEEIANDGGPDAQQNMKRGGMLGNAIPVDGIPNTNAKMFEPPIGVKGRLARALFYFSTRYNAGMSKLQEHYLRQWHEQEPVTPEEMERNDRAYQSTGIRNPFVDMPELVARVARFCRLRGGLNDNLGKNHVASDYCD